MDNVGALEAVNDYVWSLRYVDSPLVCLRDGNVDGDVGDSYPNDWARYYLTDANHNVTTTIRYDNSSQMIPLMGETVGRNVYAAYGELSARLNASWSGSNVEAGFDGPLYCGYFYDVETGLYQVRNRYYDPGLSTFINRDPIGYEGGSNLYAYCGGGPTYRTDPSGLVEGTHWFNDDWYDWLNPFAYIASLQYSKGEQLGTGIGAVVIDRFDITLDIRGRAGVRIVQDLADAQKTHYVATAVPVDAFGAQRGPDMRRTVGEFFQKGAQAADAGVAAVELTGDVLIVVDAGGSAVGMARRAMTSTVRNGGAPGMIASRAAGGWPATGVARFDQLAEESRYFAGWKANLERRGVTLDPKALGAGNPANYDPVAKVLEYDPSQFRYIDLLHETRHIGQFERAAAAGLDVSAPFASKRLYGWLESGALDYEMRQATRFGFSQEYIDALGSVRSQVWPRSYQTKYNYSSTVRETLNEWWR